MKLQTRVNKKIRDKEYKQNWVVIAPKDLDSLKWEKDQELKTSIKGNKLIIEPIEE